MPWMDTNSILPHNVKFLLDFISFPQKRDFYICVSNADRVFLAANDVKGSMHIIIIDKQFLTLGWKSREEGYIFYLISLLLKCKL